MDSVREGTSSRQRLAEEFAASAAALRGYAIRLGSDPAGADDAVAEAFAVLLAFDEERLSSIANLRAYLYTTTRNVVRRAQLTGGRVVTVVDEQLDAVVTDIAEEIAAKDARALAYRALDALDGVQRTVVLAVIVEGRSRAEVAEAIGKSSSNVSTILHRARSTLRYGYAKAYVDLNPPACGVDPALLARVVTGRAARRDVADFRRHSSACDVCPSMERSLTEELGRGSLLAVMLLALVSGAVLASPDAAVALASDPPRRPPRKTIIAMMAALIVAAGSLALALLQASPMPTGPRGPSEESEGTTRAGAVAIAADPAQITLPMPAPGESVEWSSEVTSSSSDEIALYVEFDTSPAHAGEEPTHQIRRDGAAVGEPFLSSHAEGSLSLGRLAPGGTATVSGVLTRHPDDTDQTLAATLVVRVWASADVDAAPGAGHWSVPPSSALASTGATPMPLIPLASALLALGLAAVLRAQRRKTRL
ncbi:RNA polymerase sigma factor [Microbacterium hominis]|uniref:RNA polymerase sigma factor n=1 Tax=Microbacterium hominis TaxID=162426 RepID=UPI0007689761|nr:sigma-70 family RNA polymerase sigma factor [Microbacterium hominis]KXC06626.1 hypothetical protein MhomT_04265 [Microbacterium hominis]